MKERPINFKAWEVQAIRAGRKTQFRRVVKNTGLYAIDAAIHGPEVAARELIALATRCPYGEPGDRLWVRETWGARFCHRDIGATAHHWNDLRGPLARYRTQENLALYAMKADGQNCGGWVPSIHMPRWASRITLEVVSVRVERLNEISEEDAIAEGIVSAGECKSGRKFWRDYRLSGDGTFCVGCPIQSYRTLWQSINGPGSWAENPWVWVVEFRQCE